MKKLIVSKLTFFLFFIVLILCFTGCDNSKYTKGYEETNNTDIVVSNTILKQFPDFNFDKNEGQYYMTKNSAAAENGYYCITKNASASGTFNFLYYYDMTSQTSVPLCSKLNCQHNDKDCDAYMSDEKCLGQMIWYYSGQIYMIERTTEKDILVAYDSQGRNRKEICTLSEGKSVLGFKSSGGGSACVSDGYLYYTLYDAAKNENNMTLKRIKLDTGKNSENLNNYTISNNAAFANNINCLKFYPINHSVYLLVKENAKSGYTYRVFKYDEPGNKFEIVLNMQAATLSGYCRGDILNWCTDNVIDNEGNIYYLSYIKGEALPDNLGNNGTLILNQYNVSTKVNKEVYVLEGSDSHLVRSDVLSIGGYDGKYIYLYEGVMVTNKRMETVLEDSNNIIIMNTDGSIVDKVHFSLNQEYTDATYQKYRLKMYSLNISITILGGDERYLMISTNKYNIKGLEFSDKLLDSLMKSSKNASQNQVSVTPQILAVIDKSQIGTGTITVQKIKEE